MGRVRTIGLMEMKEALKHLYIVLSLSSVIMASLRASSVRMASIPKKSKHQLATGKLSKEVAATRATDSQTHKVCGQKTKDYIICEGYRVGTITTIIWA